MAIDRSDVDSEDCSLCEDCARHPALKRFIAANGVSGTICGVCFRDPDEAPYRVADPARFEALSNLVKALIRYDYDEIEYNRHFGGDLTPSGILSDRNAIIHHEDTATHARNALDSEPFLMRLVSVVYPPYESGVALHAGYYDGQQNPLLLALKHGRSDRFSEVRRRIAQENYYAVEPAVVQMFEAIGDRIESLVAKGSAYYRARIGVEGRYFHDDLSGDLRVRSKPFEGALLGAPPPPFAQGGRLNRAGVSFLYMASDPDTAAAEVRPHPGHELSLGMFRARRDVRLARFDVDIDGFASSDQQLDLYSFVRAADNAMSLPVTPEATGRYSITQLIADVARQRGYDGVGFMSSVGAGQNVCIFDADAFAYVPDSAEVRKVASLRYELTPVEVVLTPGDDDTLIRS